MPFPDYTATVPTFVRLLADEHGDKELIVLDDRRLSYRDAEAQSARLARGLLARGVGKGTRVGLLMPNGPDWLVAWLATTRIGAVLVPLNTFFQTRELAWLLRHGDVHTLLTVSGFLSHDYLERLEAAAPGLADYTTDPYRLPDLPYLRQIFVWGECDRKWAQSGPELIASAGGEDAIDDAFLAAVEQDVTPADPMLLMYSSGSTADPKGAIHTHSTVIRHAFNLASQRDLVPEDRVWSPMPFFWVGGFVFSLVGNMHRGTTTLCEEVFDPETTLAFLERERVSVALGWPHFGKALSEHPSFASRDLSSLRAGNVPNILPKEIVPDDPLLRPNALGMTETCGPHTFAQLEGALSEDRRGSFGVTVEGVEHRVVDPESGEILPQGEFGEICVRGYSLMQGLYKMERQDVFEPDGFYRTGDGGYFDADGVLYFKGRLGEMIKTAGANVTPSEVEQVLIAYPEVKEAYVVGVDDPVRGQNVEAAVVLELDQAVDGETLRARIKKELSAYKVPRHIFIYPSGSLPFTDSGKIDKRKLVAMLEAGLASD
ncbi:MAG: acyl--CoA ligase [Deltaproteobacteria bacterium]|jgi:acyl-CoA synthetase (AMP-forming)/AMP-acid ligase II|nr:acyl--CoA ligase [Deltaproteobacteria bacterium]MBW2382294.1 acyl--CoA ligase [Deltaproteobacteria bacterium]MBW2699005.1 acyl--CoA ligase [Deltaproteobacteria bacterium]